MSEESSQRRKAEASAAVERVYRDERAAIVAGLIRLCGDFSVAEDVVQDAFSRALSVWADQGVPARPAAWVALTARRLAIDEVRRARRFREKQAVLERLEDNAASGVEVELPGEDGPQDDRLRLLFTCCHPALSIEAQIALTLRVVGGLTTREIARAFTVPDTTIGQRIVRAKRKIRDAGIPFRVPSGAALEARLDAVLKVLYLTFNEGYAATEHESLLRWDMAEEAIRLGRLLRLLLPGDPEVAGLLALMLLQHARRAARERDGRLVLLEDQDRSLWDADAIREGLAIVEDALSGGRVGPYLIQAAIAAQHVRASTPAETDWSQIVGLYTVLARIQPTPVVRLNRAAAVAMERGPEAGLALLDELDDDGSLERYHLFHAARADLLRRAGRPEDAIASYRRALQVCSSPVERTFLEERLAGLGG